jgi:hypothetical protein
MRVASEIVVCAVGASYEARRCRQRHDIEDSQIEATGCTVNIGDDAIGERYDAEHTPAELWNDTRESNPAIRLCLAC